MSTNPTSFRMPFQTQIANLLPEHQLMIRTIFNQLDDHLNAISVLKSQIESNKAAIASTNTIVNNTSSASETVVPSAAANSTGFVNNQSGNTSYTTLPSDVGNFILFSDASPVAVTLNGLGSGGGIVLPWYATLINEGVGLVTVTPASGTISYPNNLSAPSMPIEQSQSAVIIYDGTNFFAEIISVPPQTIAAITSKWLNSFTAATGLFTSTQPAFSDISGQITPSTQMPASGVSAGSYTNTNLTVNSEGLVLAAANGSGGGYSLGGTVSSSNVAFGPAAGTGPSVVTCSGLDGTHQIEFTTGSAPTATGVILTFTFTTSRGHITFPVISSSQSFLYSTFPWVGGGSATGYTLNANGTALAASSTYWIYVSAP